MDRVAAAHNNKAPRFNSLFATVDAFAQPCAEGVSFVLHNLNHVECDDAEAVIIVPEWRNRPFWRRIESGAWKQRGLYLGACFFGSEPFNSRWQVTRAVKLGTSAVKHKCE